MTINTKRNVSKFDLMHAEEYRLKRKEDKEAYLKEILRNARIDAGIVKFKFGDIDLKFYYNSQRQLTNTLNRIVTVFLSEEYKGLDVKGHIVVDVGANIGDSAIYFAIKGAEHVYAFEPFPYSCKIAEHNVKLNDLTERITVVNEGCGRKELVNIDETFENIGSSTIIESESGKKIAISSLSDVITNYNIKDGLLKIDCEGCEYPFLLNSNNENIRAFQRIIVEYHQGYRNLERKLKNAGFRVIHTPPRSNDHSALTGIIYAERINQT
jgi:FkbM family methyltransferase